MSFIRSFSYYGGVFMILYLTIGFILWVLSSYFVVKYDILKMGHSLSDQAFGLLFCFLCSTIWPLTFTGSMVLLVVNLRKHQ